MLINAYAINAIVINGGEESLLPHSGEPGSGRYVSDEELARLLEGNYGVWPRVKIADAAGVIQDYSVRGSRDWGMAISYEGNIDAPIATATVKLWREHLATLRSLAPLRSDSAWNADGPAINVGRFIQIEVACPELGVLPAESDYRVVFQGYIDSVDWAETPMTIEARDLGAQIQDAFLIEDGTSIGVTDPDLIQTRIQEVLDAAELPVAVELYVPVIPDPAVYVPKRVRKTQPVMEAVQDVASTNAWDLRARWSDALQNFVLTYKDPGRTRTDVDFTLPPSAYFGIKQMKIDATDVRNDVTVTYKDILTGFREAVRRSDPVSVARYGRRMMVVQEDDNSPINSQDLAIVMQNEILADFADPKASLAAEMPYFWPLELHDRIRFPSNGIHMDGDLDLGVVAYRHTIDEHQSRTYLQDRGNAAGKYWQWLLRNGTASGVPSSVPGSDLFTNLRQTPNYASDEIDLAFAWGGAALTGAEHFSVAISVNDQAYGAWIDVGSSTSYLYSFPGNIEPVVDPRRSPTTSRVAFKARMSLPIGFGEVTVATSAECSVTYNVA
jgi:hypothetical protein